MKAFTLIVYTTTILAAFSTIPYNIYKETHGSISFSLSSKKYYEQDLKEEAFSAKFTVQKAPSGGGSLDYVPGCEIKPFEVEMTSVQIVHSPADNALSTNRPFALAGDYIYFPVVPSKIMIYKMSIKTVKNDKKEISSSFVKVAELDSGLTFDVVKRVIFDSAGENLIVFCSMKAFIISIHNRENPTWTANSYINLTSGAMSEAIVHGKYLYISYTGASGVEIYNLENLQDPNSKKSIVSTDLSQTSIDFVDIDFLNDELVIADDFSKKLYFINTAALFSSGNLQVRPAVEIATNGYLKSLDIFGTNIYVRSEGYSLYDIQEYTLQGNNVLYNRKQLY